MVVSPSSEVDPTHYFDPVDRAVFALNHMTLVSAYETRSASSTTLSMLLLPQTTTADDSVESTQDQSAEDLRSALQRAVSAYVASSYQSDLSAGGVFAKEGKLFVAVSGEKTNLKNFWSGKWSSAWTLALGAGTATVTGDIKVHCRLFSLCASC